MTEEQFRQADELRKKLSRIRDITEALDAKDSNTTISIHYRPDGINPFSVNLKEDEVKLVLPYIRDAIKDNEKVLSKIFQEL